MFKLETIVRPSILNLVPYSSARDEFNAENAVFLDANENPFGTLNRYPDPYQRALKSKLSEIKNVDASNLFIGNGSDEIIDLLFRIFCSPNRDKALTFFPTYGMYEVTAQINDVELIQVRLDAAFAIDEEQLFERMTDPNLKLILICSPNNPTGNIFNSDTIERILRLFNGVVVVDEAYGDFSDQPSWSQRIEAFPNLVVCQTLSKAYGLAGARIGIAVASTAIIALLNKVKPPYNVSSLNQKAALKCLKNNASIQAQIELLKAERKRVIETICAFEFVLKIYPSQSNFILVCVTQADDLYNYLLRQGIVVRNRSKLIDNCLRITIGTEEENNRLIESLTNYK